MHIQNMSGDFIDNIMKEINLDIEELYGQGYISRWKVLDHLQERVSMLDNYLHVLKNNYPSEAVIPDKIRMEQQGDLPEQSGRQEQPEQEQGIRTFTLGELSQYNGKNGNPAYVAVHGIVYDVSNVGPWAGGSHFGMQAGEDHTSEFDICHVSSFFTQRLPIVGKLVTD